MKVKAVFGGLFSMLLPLFLSCSGEDVPGAGAPAVPEGMVEICPVLPGNFAAVPRDPSDTRRAVSRMYDDNDVTNEKLIKTTRLAEGSTVWLIAKNNPSDPAASSTGKLVKKSYVVYNSGDEADISYLLPCTVDKNGDLKDMKSAPLYLQNNTQYFFYAVSPARELDEEKFEKGIVAFKARNGEAFYANDSRYTKTTARSHTVHATAGTEAVFELSLEPMINQTAQLKFQIRRGAGVHSLEMQPSGIEISGLQNDSVDGISWHMSQDGVNDEPMVLRHGGKSGTYNCYDYKVDNGVIDIEVPVLPMWSLSKPVIVVFRLKVNGVPTSYEMMLNEKDFKAGYSYGYRGEVAISDGVDVITWQYVSWETDIEFPY